MKRSYIYDLRKKELVIYFSHGLDSYKINVTFDRDFIVIYFNKFDEEVKKYKKVYRDAYLVEGKKAGGKRELLNSTLDEILDGYNNSHFVAKQN